jgi:hypothetical protein
MNIDVEFIGVSRILSGVKKVCIVIPNQGTYRDVILELANMFPQFIGQLIDPTQKAFIGSSMFNIDGKRMIKTGELDNSPVEHEHLIVMSILAGG